MPARIGKSVDVAAPVERAWQLVSRGEGLSQWFTGATVVRLIDDDVPDDEAPSTALGWDMMLQRLQKLAAQP
jgi:uncharacterized protein YndB with AHSA1/START domain